MLTRKNYKVIAAIIRQAQPISRPILTDQYKEAIDSHTNLVRAFVDYLAADNPRFDGARFIAACYGE